MVAGFAIHEAHLAATCQDVVPTLLDHKSRPLAPDALYDAPSASAWLHLLTSEPHPERSQSVFSVTCEMASIFTNTSLSHRQIPPISSGDRTCLDRYYRYILARYPSFQPSLDRHAQAQNQLLSAHVLWHYCCLSFGSNVGTLRRRMIERTRTSTFAEVNVDHSSEIAWAAGVPLHLQVLHAARILQLAENIREMAFVIPKSV